VKQPLVTNSLPSMS